MRDAPTATLRARWLAAEVSSWYSLMLACTYLSESSDISIRTSCCQRKFPEPGKQGSNFLNIHVCSCIAYLVCTQTAAVAPSEAQGTRDFFAVPGKARKSRPDVPSRRISTVIQPGRRECNELQAPHMKSNGFVVKYMTAPPGRGGVLEKLL